MNLLKALIVLGVAAVAVGSVGVQVNMAAERVSTCQQMINKTTLDLVIILHQESRRAIDLSELRTSKRLYELHSRTQREFEQRYQALAEQLLTINDKAYGANEQLKALIERGCDSERQSWIQWSLFLTILTAALSCLALWLGLRTELARETNETERPTGSGPS
jgi:hypothetical protein